MKVKIRGNEGGLTYDASFDALGEITIDNKRIPYVHVVDEKQKTQRFEFRNTLSIEYRDVQNRKPHWYMFSKSLVESFTPNINDLTGDNKEVVNRNIEVKVVLDETKKYKEFFGRYFLIEEDIPSGFNEIYEQIEF